MNYQETTDYLFNQTANFEKQGASGYKEGLETTNALDEHFGHPHRLYRTIHVAGTNGKGSVSHLLAAMFQMCGYRVGLYTSPHIVDFSERIRVNGTPIAEDYVVNFVEQERAFFEPLSPSFFEIATAMAFKYFEDMNVDIAIVEVGLGGRLDCTNIITPVLSIITNISLDHTQLLGPTLSQIAREKAGIIKPGVPVVIGEATAETRTIFDTIAEERKAPIIYAEDIQEIVSANMAPDGTLHYNTKDFGLFSCELIGEYQPKNMNTVTTALLQLASQGYFCADGPAEIAKMTQEMNNAFQNVKKMTGLTARWQVVRTAPTVICDMGHNPAAWEYLHHQLENLKCRHLHIVFGMVEDKDIYSVIEKLPKKATYYFTKGSTKRAFPETSLKVFGDQFGLESTTYPTVLQAYHAALKEATTDDAIFIGGSAYVVSDFLKSRV